MSADKSISDDRPDRARFVLGGGGDGNETKTSSQPTGGSIGRRISAFLIDLFIMGILWLVGWMLIIGSLGLLAPVIFIIFAGLPVLYTTIMIATQGSATFGMRALGLKVINLADEEDPPGWPQSFILAAMFYLTLYGTSGLLLLWCLFDDRQRCLHDILSNTEIRRV